MNLHQSIEKLVFAFENKNYSKISNADIKALLHNNIICPDTAKRIQDYKKNRGGE